MRRRKCGEMEKRVTSKDRERLKRSTKAGQHQKGKGAVDRLERSGSERRRTKEGRSRRIKNSGKGVEGEAQKGVKGSKKRRERRWELKRHGKGGYKRVEGENLGVVPVDRVRAVGRKEKGTVSWRQGGEGVERKKVIGIRRGGEAKEKEKELGTRVRQMKRKRREREGVLGRA